jgi:hypothetical protein
LFAIDSVVAAQADLRLMRHTVIERPYSHYTEIRIEQTFRADSVVGSMHATGANISPAWRPFARKLANAQAPYIIDAVAPVLLGAVNLRPGWSGTASMMGWAVRNDDVFIPLNLHVDGDETVSVPAGKFDCWRITIRFANRSVSYWSRKTDGVGVRSVERDPQGVRREVILVKAESIGK